MTTEENRESWPHRLVVVEGLIGVGKTSLARKLAAAVGAGTVFEQPMENPFLERFYKDRRAAAFPAQLYFLFQRARQLSELRQHDLFAQVRVADYMLDKDRLFARIVLDDDEFKLYDQVYARLALDAPVPDLVVFLQAPVDVLLHASTSAASPTRSTSTPPTSNASARPTRAISTSTRLRRC